jgi:hypothetical protein
MTAGFVGTLWVPDRRATVKEGTGGCRYIGRTVQWENFADTLLFSASPSRALTPET